jgi:hypothetical protein
LIRVVEVYRDRGGSARYSCEQPGGWEWEKMDGAREEDEAVYIDRFSATNHDQIARIHAGEIFFLEAVV